MRYWHAIYIIPLLAVIALAIGISIKVSVGTAAKPYAVTRGQLLASDRMVTAALRLDEARVARSVGIIDEKELRDALAEFDAALPAGLHRRDIPEIVQAAMDRFPKPK